MVPIRDEKREQIERPFEEDEIKGPIWSLCDDKALRPDGFVIEFFKECWHITKWDMVKVFEEFYLMRRFAIV